MRNIYFYILLLLFAVSCNRDYSVLDSGEGIDERLIGDWVTISQSTSPGTPSNYIKGIKILPTGEIQGLAVETSTGKIKSYYPPKTESYSIIKARNNYIEFEQRIFNPPITRLCFGHYSIDDTVLHFEKDPDSPYFPIGGNFFKTTDGNKITNPIVSEMKFQVNGDSLFNQKIWPYPSAYSTDCAPYDSIEFQIISHLESNWKLIINLRNFTGPSRYILNSSTNCDVFYRSTTGCAIEEYYMEESDTGFVYINELNMQDNICSGEFAFSLNNQERILTEGNFRIPIFSLQNASITK